MPQTVLNASEWRKIAITAAIRAGKAITDIYNSADFGVEMKADDSPLTLADKAAHEIIASELSVTKIPVLSEEDAKNHSYSERRSWKQCWIVDPLDGTKEFIKRNGEFTVNIALAEEGKVTMGIVYVPVTKTLYYGTVAEGEAFTTGVMEDPERVLEQWGSREMWRSDLNIPLQPLPATFTIVGSRSHASPETEAYVNDQRRMHGEVDFVAAGSSLKFCLLAEGKAHSYPRFAPTMEWDTAAGQAVLEAAGGKVLCWPSKDPMRYNREELRNGWFLALAPGVEA